LEIIIAIKKFQSLFSDFFSCSPEEVAFKRYLAEQGFPIFGSEGKFIYVDAVQTPNNLVGLLHFVPIVAKYFNSDLIAFRSIKWKFYNKLTHYIRHKFSILQRLGAEKIILISFPNAITSQASNEFKKIQTKEDLERYFYRGVYIGDLIYDSYLNELRRPTVDLEDVNLLKIFARSLQTVDFWLSEIDRGLVRAICVNHSVYSAGIPSRVGVAKNIPVFQVTAESIYMLDKDHPIPHLDFSQYPEKFSSFSKSDQLKFRSMAEKSLRLRLSGAKTLDLHYMPVSSHSELKGSEKRILEEGNELKILIATHDFYDSPHWCGIGLYPDFMEWLNALGEISKETNFSWYIKNHPYLRGDGSKIIENFIHRYPHIRLIEGSTSHQQLVQEGIDVVLTGFGTITHEYAFYGLTAINAYPSNPHYRFNFSSSPSTRADYVSQIRHLNKDRRKFNREEIFEFYYMHYLHLPSSWIFKDYQLYLDAIKSEDRKGRLTTFTHYLLSTNLLAIETINQSIEQFLINRDYRLQSI